MRRYLIWSIEPFDKVLCQRLIGIERTYDNLFDYFVYAFNEDIHKFAAQLICQLFFFYDSSELAVRELTNNV